MRHVDAALSRATVVTVAAMLAACASDMPRMAGTGDPAAACAALMSPIAAAAIGLPSNGAQIESATPVAASAARPATLPFAPPPPEAALEAAQPPYCRVIGAIRPVDPKAPVIRFQVNLPDGWNGRSLQFGGGGFNGTLITGLALPPSSRIDKPSPLTRGFVTYGTDSGHQNAPGVALQAFASNDEALVNFAHASYKKVRDVAVDLMKRRYGRAPDKLYFMGSSEGGREGLTMAQRYPNDFDGIFSRVPVINWVGLQAAGTRMGITQMGDGWLSPAAVKVLADGVLARCDALDGLADGIVSDHEGCRAVFDPASLRCAAGVPPQGASNCLSEAQVQAVRTLHTPYHFPFELAHGTRSYPGWAYGGEAAAGSGPVGGYVSWQTGTAPQALPAGPASSRAWLYGSGGMQHFIARDANFDPRQLTPASFPERMREVSTLMDSTNPDLSAFRARGGRLVISEHMADYAQSPYAGIDYYRGVAAKFGQAAADEFVRLYITPGADHVGTGAPVGVDMLEVLVGWVERGQAPGDLVQVTLQPAAPHAEMASRPMCRYPAWPRYRAGDAARASSFECVRP